RLQKEMNFSNRLATNIKRQRSSVGPPEIVEFFNNIRDDLTVNYDGTNITDDPEAKKALVPRGRKRVERVQEHSQNIS
ncbi:hypothetical protein PPYR_15602, partial [Photinus pyralis]